MDSEDKLSFNNIKSRSDRFGQGKVEHKTARTSVQESLRESINCPKKNTERNPHNITRNWVNSLYKRKTPTRFHDGAPTMIYKKEKFSNAVPRITQQSHNDYDESFSMDDPKKSAAHLHLREESLNPAEINTRNLQRAFIAGVQPERAVLNHDLPQDIKNCSITYPTRSGPIRSWRYYGQSEINPCAFSYIPLAGQKTAVIPKNIKGKLLNEIVQLLERGQLRAAGFYQYKSMYYPISLNPEHVSGLYKAGVNYCKNPTSRKGLFDVSGQPKLSPSIMPY